MHLNQNLRYDDSQDENEEPIQKTFPTSLKQQPKKETPKPPQDQLKLTNPEPESLCDICKFKLQKDDLVAFECGHQYHMKCIQIDIINQIDQDSFPVMCSVNDCEQEPSMFLLSLLLTREKFQACIGFEQSLCPEIKENNCFNCHQRFLSDSEVNFHKCLKCKKINCLKCNGQFHQDTPCPLAPTRKSSTQSSAKVLSLSPKSNQNLNTINRSSQLKNFTEGEQVVPQLIHFTFQELKKQKNQSVVLKPSDINSIDTIRIPKLQKILPNIPDKRYRNPVLPLQQQQQSIQNQQQQIISPSPPQFISQNQRPQARVNAAITKLFSKAYQTNMLQMESQSQGVTGLGSYSPSPILSPVVGHRSLKSSLNSSFSVSNERNHSLQFIQNPEKQLNQRSSFDQYQSPRRALLAFKQQQVSTSLQLNNINESGKLKVQRSTDLSYQNTSLYEPEVATITKKQFTINQSPSRHSQEINKFYPRKPSQQLSSRF